MARQSFMNPFESQKKRFQLRSVSLAFLRIYHIFVRYGMDSEKLRMILFDYVKLINAFGIKPTLPVTASVVERHPYLFRRLQDETNVEFAIHGFRHIDYSELTAHQLRAHLSSAVGVFHKHKIRFSGYRFPFLCKDNKKMHLLHLSGFRWDSSDCIAWHFPLFDDVSKQRSEAYDQILKSYQISDAAHTVALPRQKNGILEIPLSLPDDDILVDRLGLSWRHFAGVFHEMLKQVENRGELLVFQLHPERFPWFKKSLLQMLEAIGDETHIWKPSLDEIAGWWREKKDFQCLVHEIKEGYYHISTRCTDRASVLIKNNLGMEKTTSFWKSWHRISKKQWKMKSPKKPIIGVHPSLAETVTSFLRDEGYVFEINDRPNQYSLFLEPKILWRNENVENPINDAIERTPFPLIRFWRWPEKKRCCMAMTGDVDAIDIWDYFVRYYG